MHRELITSRQNPRVKDVVKLRSARERVKCGRFVVDGSREIARAVAAGVSVLEAFACEDLTASDEDGDAVKAATAASQAAFDVSRVVMERLCFGERAGPVLIVAETPVRSLADLVLPERPLVAVVESLEKPGNVGAVLRSADGAGVDAVVVADPVSDLFNPNTIRASLGTVFGPNVCTATSAETIAWLAKRGVRAVATMPEAAADYTDADLTGPLAIVLGSEAEGLSPAWESSAEGVRLPMAGIADSLNVSATAAVLFYEARRQREGMTG
ncbi:MAG: TrmH family RNA methyltransferase [Planctomycetota bacterium]